MSLGVGHGLTPQSVQRPLPMQHMREGAYSVLCESSDLVRVKFCSRQVLLNGFLFTGSIVVLQLPRAAETIRIDVLMAHAYPCSGISAVYMRTANLVLPLMAPHQLKGERSRTVKWKAHTRTITQPPIHPAMATTTPRRWPPLDEDLQLPKGCPRRLRTYDNIH